MKKLCSVLLAVVMLLSVLSSAGPVYSRAARIIEQGRCGDGVSWLLTSDGVLTISGNGNMKDFDDSPQSDSLARIPEDTKILSVKVEDGVTGIGNNAFHFCKELLHVEIADTVSYIGEKAFAECDSLYYISLPEHLTSIGGSCFAECKALRTIQIPSSVTYLGPYAFYGCVSLETIEIPAGITCLNQGVLENCSRLSSVKLHDGLTKIGTLAFSECTDLRSLDIPNGVTIIDVSAFQNCIALEKISIPESLTKVFDEAFNGCDSLSEVEYAGSPKQWNSISFEDDRSPLFNTYVLYKKADEDVNNPTAVPSTNLSGINELYIGKNIHTIAAVPGLSTERFLSQFDGGRLLNETENALHANSLIGTGASVTDSDGRKWLVIVPADANGDGKVNSSDARLALRTSARVSSLEGAFFAAADIDDDGKLKSNDARIILRISARLDSITEEMLQNASEYDNPAEQEAPLTKDPVTTQTQIVNRYTILYHPDRLSPAAQQQTAAEYGRSTATLTTETLNFENNGYFFAGWRVYREDLNQWFVKNQKGTCSWMRVTDENLPQGYEYACFSNGAEVSDLARSGNVHFYAEWNPHVFTIYYHPDDNAAASEHTSRVTFGEQTPILTVRELGFEKKGYTFAGWRVYREDGDEWRVRNPQGELEWITLTDGTLPTGYSYEIYPDGQTVAKTSPYANAHFYAVWEADPAYVEDYYDYNEDWAEEENWIEEENWDEEEDWGEEEGCDEEEDCDDESCCDCGCDGSCDCDCCNGIDSGQCYCE